ncbi:MULTISPECIES: hypothetical protein [Bradyrhizobium]|jgi:hypothetical protein|uniref:hypothetical protein n=1 Tax=Bradyrhizobium TaxID=374 RepID=UPI0009B6C554|nr:hypothetical protein [Bradyrhizobium elkanii]WLA79703.1 hypothetical protein QNJ99_30455 [Bradyrhizobium elkanii]
MIRMLKVVAHIVWAVSMIGLGTLIGASYGWAHHGLIGAIALGTVGSASGHSLPSIRSSFLNSFTEAFDAATEGEGAACRWSHPDGRRSGRDFHAHSPPTILAKRGTKRVEGRTRAGADLAGEPAAPRCPVIQLSC